MNDTTQPPASPLVCRDCGVTYPHTTEFFHKNGRGDELRRVCKPCASARSVRWYAENREQALAYRHDRADSLRGYYRDYQQAHLLEHAVAEHKRRARVRAAAGTHTPADVLAQYARQKGRCFWCHKKLGSEYHIDHVVPLVKKGSNGPENIVLACPSCNLRKGTKHPMDFAGVML